MGGRRGGSARVVLGGVARGEGTSTRGRAAGNSGTTRGSHEEQEVARGRPRAAGAARQAVGGAGNRGVDWRKKIRDLNVISEIPGTHL